MMKPNVKEPTWYGIAQLQWKTITFSEKDETHCKSNEKQSPSGEARRRDQMSHL